MFKRIESQSMKQENHKDSDKFAIRLYIKDSKKEELYQNLHQGQQTGGTLPEHN